MIDMNKKYRTRDGREVRILCTDREDSEYPVVALVKYEKERTELTQSYTGKGKYLNKKTESSLDLVEAKPEVVRWANVYSDSIGASWPSKSLADRGVDDLRSLKGILKITFIEGENPKFEYEPV